MKIFFLLIAALITGGGCGGGGGGGGDNNALVSVSMSDENLEAFGYIDIEAVIASDISGDKGLTLVLYGARDGGREEVLASLPIRDVLEGVGTYHLPLEVAAYDRDMEVLPSGLYGSARFELQRSTTSGEHTILGNRSAGKGLNYTTASELPIIVKNTLMLDVKDAPKTEGFDGDVASFQHESGWQAMVAGVMNGEPVVVAYVADFDIRMELRGTAKEVAGIEITENGGAKIVGKFGDDPVKTYLLEGPFESGEVGVTLTAMYWGNETPPDVGSVSFTVKAVPADGASNARSTSDRFVAQIVTDETLTLARTRTRSTPSRAAVDKMEYRDFASMVWNLWMNYEINPLTTEGKSQWDEVMEPAYFFARLYKDLGVIVDWSTAVAEAPYLENLRIKQDFFNGDRALNFEDSRYGLNQTIRVPKVYREAENEYTRLYNLSGSFPYGNKEYVSWWATLPSWMLRENIFPRPARNYATITIGDMRDDDYFWTYVIPTFEGIAVSYGIASYQYDVFWSQQLGNAQDGYAEPKLTKEEYRAILPTGNVIAENLNAPTGGTLKETPYTSRPIELYYGFNESEGKQWGQYGDYIEYGKTLGTDSKIANVGYLFIYDDGVSLESAATSATDTKLVAKNWTKLTASTPAWLLGFEVTPFYATAGFEFDVTSSAKYDSAVNAGVGSITWMPLAGDSANAKMYVQQKLLTITMFDKQIDFKFGNTPKPTIDSHEEIKYPLIDRAFEKQVVDPDKASFTIAGVKLSLGVDVEGEVGMGFTYRFGALIQAASTPTNYQQTPLAIQMKLTPEAKFGIVVTVSAEIPLSPPLPSFTIGIKGSVTLIKLELPLGMERQIALAARKIDPSTVDKSTGLAPETSNGKWYYTMEGTKRYTLDLTLSGLDGSLALTTQIGAAKENEHEIFSWDGITYGDWRIFESTTFRPVALPLDRDYEIPVI